MLALLIVLSQSMASYVGYFLIISANEHILKMKIVNEQMLELSSLLYIYNSCTNHVQYKLMVTPTQRDVPPQVLNTRVYFLNI